MAGVILNPYNGWETITKNIHKTDDFDRELEKTKYFERRHQATDCRAQYQQRKVNAIFNFVKSRVKWNGETGFLCHYGLKMRTTIKSGM
jgi:hypothetical protein